MLSFVRSGSSEHRPNRRNPPKWHPRPHGRGLLRRSVRRRSAAVRSGARVCARAFAHCRLLRRLAFFDVSLRQTPFQMSASRMTCDDRHATFVVEHQPARRIFAYHRQFLRVERCERGRSVRAAPPWHHRRRRRARRDDRPLLQRHRLRCVQQFVRFQRILGMVVRSIGKHACKICGRNHDSNHTQFCVQVE